MKAARKQKPAPVAPAWEPLKLPERARNILGDYVECFRPQWNPQMGSPSQFYAALMNLEETQPVTERALLIDALIVLLLSCPEASLPMISEQAAAWIEAEHERLWQNIGREP